MRPSLARFFAKTTCFAALAMSIAPRAAHAQDVTESEKQAARNLYIDAVGLQANQHYAEALDKLQRAQQVVPAPTNLLHIAECEVGLGRLVDASETYLTITKMSVGTNEAFLRAQAQAGDELAALKPRIPTLKIDVTPKDAPNLTVTVDGHEVKNALLDVAMPLDPATHKIVAVAPGFTTDSRSVSLGERDQKLIALSLTSTGGVVYSSADGVPPLPPPVNSGHPPAPPPRVETRPSAVATKSERTFILGVSLGVLSPGGDVTGATGDTMSNAAGAGAGFGLEAGFRFSKLSIGVEYEHGALGNGDAVSAGGTSITTSAASNYIGISGVYISHPQGVGFWAELGGGYRAFSTSTRTANAVDSSMFSEVDQVYSGGEARLGAGIYIRASSWLRLIPKATVSVGSFSGVSGSCSSGGASFNGACVAPSPSSIPQPSSHSFLFLGVSGDYEGSL